jgi:hypothetical protein
MKKKTTQSVLKTLTKPMSEQVFQKMVLEAFQYDNTILLWRRNVGAAKMQNGSFIRFAESGQADLWGIIDWMCCPVCGQIHKGKHLEIELKSGSGKETALQKNWLDTTRKCNGIAFVLRPAESDPIGLRDRTAELIKRELAYQCCGTRKI